MSDHLKARKAEAEEFSLLLKIAAAEAYTIHDDGTFSYNQKFFPEPKWQKPEEIILETIHALNHEHAARDIICRDTEAYISVITAWLKDQDISRISRYDEGTTAMVFEAKTGDDKEPRLILRIGCGSQDIAAVNREKRIWCPASLWPDNKHEFEGISLEISPLLRCRTPKTRYTFNPLDYYLFIDNHVFKDTPFFVNHGNDIGIMPDGTPIYVDAGDVMLSSRYKQADITEQWKQRVMAQMAENCRDLPEQFQFVVETSPGFYKTKQEILFPSSRRPGNKLSASTAPFPDLDR